MVEKRRNLCRYLDNAFFNHLKWNLSKDSCIRVLGNKTSFYLFFSKWTVKLLHKYEIIAEKEFEAADTSDKGICCDVIHTEKFYSENKIISKWKINYIIIILILFSCLDLKNPSVLSQMYVLEETVRHLDFTD